MQQVYPIDTQITYQFIPILSNDSSIVDSQIIYSYPPVIKRGNWKSTRNSGFNRKTTDFHSVFSSKPCLMTGGYVNIPSLSSSIQLLIHDCIYTYIMVRSSIPYAPWSWNIYLHLPELNHPVLQVNICKYTSTVEHLGYVYVYIYIYMYHTDAYIFQSFIDCTSESTFDHLQLC